METRKIGVSLPPLEVEELPTPEEAFKTRRIGVEELILLVLGPSVIALGIAIGSGEWLLGPLNVGKYGFQGIFWIVLVSAILQVFYNVELGRYTLATGEPPILGFGRMPPGYLFWIPVGLICFYMAFILGGWTVSAGSSLFALFSGRLYNPEELEFVRLLGIGLLISIFLILLIGRKIERTMEAFQGLFLPYILIGLIMVTLVVVPLGYWGRAIFSLLIPARPPEGTDVSLLGALAGFTALASGLNFMFIGYYRDKGYGMGSRVGYLAGVLGGEPKQILPGRTFPEDEKNATVWKRWFRYLTLDQWGVFFPGVLLGMVLPSILVGYLVQTSANAAPDQTTILTFAAIELGQRYGAILAGWAFLVGFVILYSTQIVVLELLARNLTDAVFGIRASRGERHSDHAWLFADSRRFYYLTVIGLILVIAVLIHLALPVQLIVTSANLSNFAALIFPLVMIYLNRQLPRPAKITWWSYLVLVVNAIFFGFFFLNFLATQIWGTPLVRF